MTRKASDAAIERACDECSGRGWVERIDVYERPCDACFGKGFHLVARAIAAQGGGE